MDEAEKLLSALYTDILMLADGSWQPDKKSISATIDTIETLALELNLTITDNREEQ